MSSRKRALLMIISIALSMAMSSDRPETQNFVAYSQEIPGSDLSFDFVPIAGGKFNMGSPESEAGRNPDEGPQHEVVVSDFWMSTLEVTWDQFELFLYRETDGEVVKENRELTLEVDGIAGATMPYVNFNKPGYPLVNVTQYAASTFCKWLSAKTGHFYRLPTEAEWEYASKAGGDAPFSFDKKHIDDFAWYGGNSNGKSQKGGKKKANAWGLYDMHGNVAEWVLDAYSDMTYGQREIVENPVYTTEELYPRVVRGGSFNDPLKNIRATARQFSDKSWKKRDPQIPKSLWWLTDALHVGFRVVRPVQVPPKSEWEKYWGKPIREY
ncbi:SUMF1/EgtB/PvdO family nonheme iron enzyme [Roseivirga sp. E12]|uniref:formylglycine-generating enzyme family protein n=1 Tax=Roseivirga sp. E12 TaxID=2819237 RepID=UPI001ABCF931|nr:SUMF1/EgtB/PvdO family nonheme iron enzyme [Roseivirga sp. E12]MBO3699915.1 SUMF1/EgtB/PvdO family nonheme iron enzyme [Roseivirga sp. E12]